MAREDDISCRGEIKAEAVREFEDALEQFLDGFTSKDDPNKIISISELENNWEKMNDETRRIFQKVMSKAISSLNEKDIVKSKKENTKERG